MPRVPQRVQAHGSGSGTGGAGGSTVRVRQDSSTVLAAADTLDFKAGFDVSDDGGSDAGIKPKRAMGWYWSWINGR